MRSNHLLALALTLPSLAMSSIVGASNHDLKTLEQKASYSIGVNFIQRMAAQGITLDVDAMTHGLKDASAGNKTALSAEVMADSMKAFMEKLKNDAAEKQKKAAQVNIEAGKAFLKDNATKEGVVTTKSGLQYKIIKEGNGATPTLNDTVVTHYKGNVISGEVFDSSYKRGTPATFPVKGVIKGWTEALQLMKVGDKWQLFIPSDLAYGGSAKGEVIGANSTLIFDIELLEIKSAK